MHHLTRILAIIVAVVLPLGAQGRVTIVDNSVTHYASGEMRAAAVDGAESAYIYCDISSSILGCGAADGHGHFASCYTDDIRAKELFASLGTTATLVFFFNPGTGRCDSVTVSNSSLQFDTLSPAAPHYSAPAYVDLGYRYAYGAMNSPTPDTQDGVSCTSGSWYVRCDITSSAGQTATCYVTGDTPTQTLDDARLAVAGFNASSYVYFRWEGDNGGQCLDLFISNGSWYLQ